MQASIQVRQDMILELVALSGDFPTSLIPKLSGSVRYTRDTINDLVAANLLRRYRKDKLPSLRLTLKGRRLLLEADYGRFCELLEGRGLRRSQQSNLRNRHRLHRMAGAYLVLLELGIAVHRDEKADIFGTRPWEPGSEAVRANFRTPCFYSSFELKTMGSETLRIKGTRALGALLTEGAAPYFLYNTGSAPMKWGRVSEQKLSGILEGTLAGWQLPHDTPHGIMLGDDMETLLRLLESDGGEGRRFYRVDETFPAFHYVPICEAGKRLFGLLCKPGAKQRIREALSEPPPAKPPHRRYPCDAEENGRAVLFAWDLDMVRLRHFHDGLKLFGERGVILCQKWQAPVLERYFSGLASIELLGDRPFDKEDAY